MGKPIEKGIFRPERQEAKGKHNALGQEATGQGRIARRPQERSQRAHGGGQKGNHCKNWFLFRLKTEATGEL